MNRVLLVIQTFSLAAITFCLEIEFCRSNDLPKSLDDVLSRVQKLEMPTDLTVMGNDYELKENFTQRCAFNGERKLIVAESFGSDGTDGTYKAAELFDRATISLLRPGWLRTDRGYGRSSFHRSANERNVAWLRFGIIMPIS